jgi:hypothetical protein
MTKKTTNIQKFFKKARKRLYNDTKNMTVEEKHDYIVKRAEIGKKRVNAAIQTRKEKESRDCQVLIRLTESERSQLETDAKQEKTTLSSLIRSRALKETNHFNTVITHLKKIESTLNKIKRH